MNLRFELLCGGRGNITSIVNGRKNDPPAKLVTCKNCLRVLRRLTG